MNNSEQTIKLVALIDIQLLMIEVEIRQDSGFLIKFALHISYTMACITE